MIVKFNDISSLKYDFIIIGAGPAGIVLSLELQKKAYKILLIEGGSLVYDNDHHLKYDGLNIGNIEYPILYSRLNYFGGTSNHWGGWCHPLDDFDKHIANFNTDGFSKLYDRAESYLHINKSIEFNSDTKIFNNIINVNNTDFKHTIFKFSPPTRFNEDYYPHIKSSKNIFLLLNTELEGIEKINNNELIVNLNNENNYINLKTNKKIIVSCGGIENYKIVRKIKFKNKNIFNNPSYFEDHLGFNLGDILVNKKLDYNIKKVGDCPVMPRLVLNLKAANENKMNFAIGFQPRHLTDIEKMLTIRKDRHIYRVSCTLSNPYLKNKIDYNNKKIEINISEISYVQLIKKIEELLIRNFSKIPEIIQYIPSNSFKNSFSGNFGNHHMMTVPINIKNNDIYVNENLLLNKTNNIYILGSSAFNYTSYANPTLTIVALSIKLANHLSKQNI